MTRRILTEEGEKVQVSQREPSTMFLFITRRRIRPKLEFCQMAFTTSCVLL